jgi:CrcB protein
MADASTGLSLQVSGVLVNAMGFVAVGLGAALGAWLRWGLSMGLNHLFANLPLGTFACNIIGGYFIGVAVEVVVHHSLLTPELRLFLMTGFLGGLTTFSTFSAEAVGLLSRAQYGWAVALILAHLVGSLTMTIFGMMTVRALSG